MGSLEAQSAARMPVHHLDEALLLDYAAGACSEAEALVIASHLTLCPLCRDALAALERIGGALVSELPPADFEPDALARLFARLDGIGSSDIGSWIAGAPEPTAMDSDRSPPCAARPVAPQPPASPILLPAPLQAYVGNDVDALDWRSVTRGIDEVALTTRGGGAKARLMRIRAGTKVPPHTHEGSEITLVLGGGFADGDHHFLRGDVAISDHEVDHSPIADDDGDCICLAVTDAPLRLTGKIGRFLNPFIRF